MKYRKRTYYTEEQKALMWERWRKGESLHKIAELFGRHHGSVRGILMRTGGIQPPPRRRPKRALSLNEREEISRGLVGGQSLRNIAAALGRNVSTISREIQRNGGAQSYRASDADQAAWDRALRPKVCKLAMNRDLAMTVAKKLQADWSPEQIAGWLKNTNPFDRSQRVSHETIYRTLYIQTRGALKQELLSHLRRKRAMRRSRHYTQKTPDHGQLRNMVPISQRPPGAEDRALPGHWEGDLLCGTTRSQIATLVERKTRYLMLVKVDRKDSATVIDALIKNAKRLPEELYRSLTWDRGAEMAAHERFTLATDIQVYFCDPHHPWQRGSNENTNGLLRQYFPKGINLSGYSQAQLDAIARRLNERPRKTLNYETPAEQFSRFVALTG